MAARVSLSQADRLCRDNGLAPDLGLLEILLGMENIYGAQRVVKREARRTGTLVELSEVRRGLTTERRMAALRS